MIQVDSTLAPIQKAPRNLFSKMIAFVESQNLPTFHPIFRVLTKLWDIFAGSIVDTKIMREVDAGNRQTNIYRIK